MQNFISDEHFLEGLRDELRDLICYEKNNDLYKFHQVRVCVCLQSSGQKLFKKVTLIS